VRGLVAADGRSWAAVCARAKRFLYGEGEGRTFQEIIEAGSTLGWHSFDQMLLKAYEADLIAEETALTFCTHKHKMHRDVDLLKKLRGGTFEMPSGLRMEEARFPAKRADRRWKFLQNAMLFDTRRFPHGKEEVETPSSAIIAERSASIVCLFMNGQRCWLREQLGMCRRAPTDWRNS
jgi:hypothetical protein